MAAFGLFVQPIEARAEFDPMAHYSEIFEDVFLDWVRLGARADACGQPAPTPADEATFAERAAAVFRPGFFNWRERGDYVEQLGYLASFARIAGMLQAQDEGCFGIALLVRTAEQTMDAALDAAEDSP